MCVHFAFHPSTSYLDSFMAQLAKDEAEIKATQLVRNTLLTRQSAGEPHSFIFFASFLQTPSSQQSFTSVLGTTHFSNSLGADLSMDAYFQQKSGKLGQLSASKLPPSERVRVD